MTFKPGSKDQSTLLRCHGVIDRVTFTSNFLPDSCSSIFFTPFFPRARAQMSDFKFREGCLDSFAGLHMLSRANDSSFLVNFNLVDLVPSRKAVSSNNFTRSSSSSKRSI